LSPNEVSPNFGPNGFGDQRVQLISQANAGPCIAFRGDIARIPDFLITAKFSNHI
jgi:hypothetical protein